MSDFETRRQFLKVTAAGGALAGMGGYEFLRGLPPVSAAETKLAAKQVRLSPSIEPLVQLIEKTPRNALLETIAQKIRKGLSYRETLAALLLTGVRNVQPRPAVGFKFHAVLVVNSAHLASLSSPDSDRWLPIFWALDYCKSKQLEEERTSGWKLPPVDEKSVPPASRAKKALIDALEKWDEQAADAATASLARSAGSNEIFEILFRYGSRDFRSIGHKAIFVANSRRTLSCIGWQHAEPVLRSLVYAMLNHRGEPNPAKSDLSPDRPFRRNLELAGKIRKDYRDGKLNASATRERLEQRCVRPGRQAAQLRHFTAINLGCRARWFGRTTDAATRHHRFAHVDHGKRHASRVLGNRRRHDAPIIASAKLRVPADVPRDRLPPGANQKPQRQRRQIDAPRSDESGREDRRDLR